MKSVIKPAILLASIMPLDVLAADPRQSELDNPVAVLLLVVVGALALAIGILAHVVIGAAHLKVKNDKQAGAKGGILLILCFMGKGLVAQDSKSGKLSDSIIAGLSDTSFYALITVIALELTVLLWLLNMLRSFIRQEKEVHATKPGMLTEIRWKRWWIKINSFRSASEEGQIDMGHDYDNIRELDNKLPPWWLYGFYITIVFAGIYLWRYHVSHSAPLSIREYEIAVIHAERAREISLKKAGNTVDENTVKLLTAAEDIESGRRIFALSCASCHGADGGGIVGPNLVDDYWLHGGRINDIFKTIKYGVPEKGMQPWKGTFSPAQLAQLASFIRSIRGTKVAKPKEPQGDIYKEQPVKVDTLKIAGLISYRK